MSHPGLLGKLTWDPARPDSEVLAKAERRRFTAPYELRLLQEVEQSANRELSALLRREGMCSLHLSKRPRQRQAGQLNSPWRQPSG